MPFRVTDDNARPSGLITFGNYLWREMKQTGQDRQDRTDRTGQTGQDRTDSTDRADSTGKT